MFLKYLRRLEERDCLKAEATENNDDDLFEEFKLKRNVVKKKILEDQKEYVKKEFDGNPSSSNIWKSAYKIVGMNSNKAPTQINDGGVLVNSPEKMANTFNRVFLDKVKKIREKACQVATNINPVQRLRSWLNQRSSPLPEFELKPISIQKLRKIIKKMKGGRSHGRDYIDSYSLKVDTLSSRRPSKTW